MKRINIIKDGSLVKDELDHLCYLIVTLDSVRAFRRPKPETIEEAFKKLGKKELTNLWKEIKHDVEKIVYLPMRISGLPSLMRLVAILKMIIPIVSFFMMFSLAMNIMPLFKRLQGTPLMIFGNPHTFIITSMVSLLMMLMLVATDYKIRKRVIKYEEEHASKFSRGRERIKRVIEELVEIFSKELKKSKEDPNKYKMLLFYEYRGLTVLRERRGRIIKRKYPLYEVVCSL